MLDATYELLNERPDGSVSDDDVERLLPAMEPVAVRQALQHLADQGYISAYRAFGGRIDSIQPREKGLQIAMGWPHPGAAKPEDAELLLRLLDQRIASASTEEERSRFKRLRDAAADTGQTMVSEILAAYLARATGLD